MSEEGLNWGQTHTVPNRFLASLRMMMRYESGGAERALRHFDPLRLGWVALSGTLAERKDVQVSLRGCNAETA